MVQLNKDERVWARVQNAHEVQRLWPNCWPGRRVPNPCDTQELKKNTRSMALA